MIILKDKNNYFIFSVSLDRKLLDFTTYTRISKYL